MSSFYERLNQWTQKSRLFSLLLLLLSMRRRTLHSEKNYKFFGSNVHKRSSSKTIFSIHINVMSGKLSIFSYCAPCTRTTSLRVVSFRLLLLITHNASQRNGQVVLHQSCEGVRKGFGRVFPFSSMSVVHGCQ